MTNLSSDESSAHTELSKSRGIEDNELYRYIPPPIPLIPKNKYTDDLPRSYFLMLYFLYSYLKRLFGIEKDYYISDENGRPISLGPEISFFSLCEGK